MFVPTQEEGYVPGGGGGGVGGVVSPVTYTIYLLYSTISEHVHTYDMHYTVCIYSYNIIHSGALSLLC